MKYLNEWAKDKPLGLAIIAQQLALSAEYCFLLADEIKKKEGFIHNLPDPKLDEWLRLYKQHHRIISLFDDTFLDSKGFIEEAKEIYDFFSQGLKYLKDNPMESIRAEYEELNPK